MGENKFTTVFKASVVFVITVVGIVVGAIFSMKSNKSGLGVGNALGDGLNSSDIKSGLPIGVNFAGFYDDDD